MLDYECIKDFADKWIEYFNVGDMSHFKKEIMMHQCETLGFGLYEGSGFKRDYGIATFDNDALKKIIDNLDDVKYLGSVISWKWNYYFMYDNTGECILEPDNKEWSLIALERLSYLAEIKRHGFKGEVKNFKLVSKRSDKTIAEPDKEIEQHLSINQNGDVWISGYGYSEKVEYEELRTVYFTINPFAVEYLFYSMGKLFEDPQIFKITDDTEVWNLELLSDDGTIYNFKGPLCAELISEEMNFSDIMREILQLYDLYLFDGKAKFDRITRVIINYHREMKDASADFSGAKDSTEIKEQFVIDRIAGIIDHVYILDDNHQALHRYAAKDFLEDLFNYFDAETFFQHIEGNSPDVIEDPLDKSKYSIIIDYENKPQKEITGTFDKKSLPDDYPEFIEIINDFISSYPEGVLNRRAVYNQDKRGKGDYTYLSVSLNNGGKTYYYQTDIENIEPYDKVLIPVGIHNKTRVGTVENIEYFNEKNLPFPLNKTKKVINKYLGDEALILEYQPDDKKWIDNILESFSSEVEGIDKEDLDILVETPGEWILTADVNAIISGVVIATPSEHSSFDENPLGISTPDKGENENLQITAVVVYDFERNKGIGTKLIRAMINKAQDMDMEKIFTVCTKEQLSLYRALGFEKTSREPFVYKGVLVYEIKLEC